MNKVIAFYKPVMQGRNVVKQNGKAIKRDIMSIKHPVEAARLEGESDTDFCQRLIDKEIHPDLKALAVIIDVDDIPKDRTNRDKWEIGTDKKVKVKA